MVEPLETTAEFADEPAPDRGGRRAFSALAAVVGFGAGLLGWMALVGIAGGDGSAGPSVDVLRARELGVVSATVRAGYDKTQELVAWILGCALLPLASWAAWSAAQSGLAGRARGAGFWTSPGAPVPMPPDGARARPGSPRGPRPSAIPTWFPAVAVLATALASAFRPARLLGHNPWGSFGFLGEEGVYLGAVQALRSGRVLYRDLQFPYGPLMLQPLDLWLRLVGDSVSAARFWVASLHAAGILAVAATVRLLVGPRHGPWAGLLAAVLAGTVAPVFLPTLNSALLRPALAFLPAALAWAALAPSPSGGRPRRAWRDPLTAAGALAALGGLLSPEVGAAAAAACVAALLLARARRTAWLRSLGGALVATVLGLAPLAVAGGLPAWAIQTLQSAELAGLGYQALPYPDVAAIFADAAGHRGRFPPNDPATRIWAILPPLFIWGGLAAGLCGLRRQAGGGPGAPALLLGVAGAVLFRGALGRSDLYHLWFYGSLPVTLLGALGAAAAWRRLPREMRPLVPTAAALLGLLLVVLRPEQEVRFPDAEESVLARAAGIQRPLRERAVDAPRLGGVRLRPRLAAQVEAITRRVARIDPQDGVLFYPSEASYYFLCDRPPPSRFLWAYDAATAELRREAVAELESTRPRWLLWSADTFPVDWIPQNELVPELEAYLRASYRPVEVLPGATLLERVGR
jgi:hypothetical protein